MSGNIKNAKFYSIFATEFKKDENNFNDSGTL